MDLSSFLNAVTGGGNGYLRDAEHASRLYRDDNFYDLAPKAGWMYYVRLGINPAIDYGLNKSWSNRFKRNVGLLVKSVELPTFSIQTETVNQYNRKTVVQTRLNYNPVTITFHDDMANAVTDLWRNYYGYYFSDGKYSVNGDAGGKTAQSFSDTKYGEQNYAYGLANSQAFKFFNSIEIFLLNKQKFTSLTLLNPLIKQWNHGSIDQTQGNKLMESKMVIEYEAVTYNTGKAKSVEFNKDHYDRTPSPLSVAGGGVANIFGAGGVVAGASEVFGDISSINKDTSALDLLGIGLKAANVAKNASKIDFAKQIKREGYSILTGQLSSMGKSGWSEYSNQVSRNGFNIGGIQITSGSSGNSSVANTFNNFYNESVAPRITARPATPSSGSK
jgi:hypothetical protein